MTGPGKRKGDRAELEAQGLWRDHTGVAARRALGAGRRDDIGDITAIPHTVCQVVNWRDVAAAVRAKPKEAEDQRERAGMPFACTFVRLKGGEFRVVMTPEQFFAMWREAIN